MPLQRHVPCKMLTRRSRILAVLTSWLAIVASALVIVGIGGVIGIVGELVIQQHGEHPMMPVETMPVAPPSSASTKMPTTWWYSCDDGATWERASPMPVEIAEPNGMCATPSAYAQILRDLGDIRTRSLANYELDVLATCLHFEANLPPPPRGMPPAALGWPDPP